MSNDIVVDFKSNLNSVTQAKDFYDTHSYLFCEQSEEFLLKLLRRFIKLNSDHNGYAYQQIMDPLAGQVSYIKFEIETMREKKKFQILEQSSSNSYAAAALSAGAALIAAVVSIISLFTKK